MYIWKTGSSLLHLLDKLSKEDLSDKISHVQDLRRLYCVKLHYF